MMSLERLTLDRWWSAEGRRLVGGVTNAALIPDRPPDRFVEEERYEDSVRSEHIERRWSLFSTWPVKVIVVRTPVHALLSWNTEDGTVGVRVWLRDDVTSHEEDVA